MRTLRLNHIIAHAAAFAGFIGLAGCFTGPSAVGASSEATDETVTLLTRGDADGISVTDLENRVAFEPVFLSVEGPGAVSLPFFEKNLKVSSGALVLLGAGTDTLYAAVMNGAATAAGETAGPGDILLWTPGEAAPRNSAFDVDRFSDSINVETVAAVDGLRPALDRAAARQGRGLRFGQLRRTPFNAVTPTDPETFERRRRYLNRPAVVRLRFETGENPQALSMAVAEAFVEALVADDAATVADLFHPDLLDLDSDEDFGRTAKTLPASVEEPENLDEAEARLAIARGLTRDGRDDLEPASLRRLDASTTSFFVTSDGLSDDRDGYIIALRPGDGLYFVTAFTPSAAPPEPTTRPATRPGV